MINCRIKEISLMLFIFVLSATNIRCGFCKQHQELKENLPLYEALAEKVLKNKSLLSAEYPGPFPFKILYPAGNKSATSNNNRYKDIMQLCEKLNILYIQVNAENIVFLYFQNHSDFFQGESIEEFIEVKEQDNKSWTDFQNESSERQIMCDVNLSNKSRYVKIISSN